MTSLSSAAFPFSAAVQVTQLLLKLASPGAVVHVGAGSGEGASHAWRKMPVNHALLVDRKLPEWIDSVLPYHPGWKAVDRVASEFTGEADWYELTNRLESGLVSATLLNDIWPQLRTLEHEKVAAVSIDELIANELAAWEHKNVNWLILDCLPALPLLRGAQQSLKDAMVVWVRTIFDSAATSPENCLPEIESFLAAEGFQYVFSMRGVNPRVGSAVFMRPVSPYEINAGDAAAPASMRQTTALNMSYTDEACRSKLFIQEQSHLLSELGNNATESNHSNVQLAEQTALLQQALALNETLSAERDKLTVEIGALKASQERYAYELAEAPSEKERSLEASNKHDQQVNELTIAVAHETQAKLSALAKRDATALELFQLKELHREAKERINTLEVDLQSERDHAVEQNSLLQTQLTDAVSIRNQVSAELVAANSELDSLRQKLGAQREQALADRKKCAVLERHLIERDEHIRTIEAALDGMKTELGRTRAASVEIAQKAEKHELALTSKDNETSQLRAAVRRLEARHHEDEIRCELLQEALIRADGQICLIKDVLLREAGL